MYRSIQLKPSIPKPQAVAIALNSGARSLQGENRKADEASGGALRKAMRRPEFRAAAGSLTTLYADGAADQRIFVIGLGDAKNDDQDAALRAGAAKLVKAANKAGIRSIDIRLEGKRADAAAGRTLGEGLGLALFQFDDHKGSASKKDAAEKKVTATLQIAVPRAMLAEAKRGLTTGQSANIARELAATPPNVADPAYLASYCRRMAKKSGLRCSVIDDKKAAGLGMGGLVAVGQAGSTPSRLIVLEHRPAGSAGEAPVLLVGKAITFDTGGYSLKPVTGITSMKYDKCGGTTVIAAMHAIAALKIPVPVVGLIAAAENMIDSTAYRPDDILTLCNGVTVEIVSTDAEGRLVLADALAYGCGKFKPRAVIDLATLTGGVIVALGRLCAGAFCNDDKLMQRLEDAGETTGERLWRLPLWKEYRKLLKSGHADITNSAGREAHPIQGAAFLSHFVARDGDFEKNDPVPWAHLDIAGVANVESARDHFGLFPKGPTGFGVRLLVKTLEDFAKKK